MDIETLQLKPADGKRRMLVCFAHPDDESFGNGGTLAHYARAGVDVHLICATRGEVGTIDQEYLNEYGSPEALRSAELECAARTLGLTAVYYLGYRDSGMPGSPDNEHQRALVATPVEELTARMVQLIRAVQPQVMLTFDPIGGYRHPDHIAMHAGTVAAYDLAGDETYQSNGLAPYTPQKLYFSTFSRRGMRWLLKLMPLVGQNPRTFGRNGDIDLVALSKVNFPLHATIDISAELAIKRAASACHRSQQSFGTNRIVRMIFRRRQTRETFMRARPEAPRNLREKDLFEDVEV